MIPSQRKRANTSTKPNLHKVPYAPSIFVHSTCDYISSQQLPYQRQIHKNAPPPETWAAGEAHYPQRLSGPTYIENGYDGWVVSADDCWNIFCFGHLGGNELEERKGTMSLLTLISLLPFLSWDWSGRQQHKILLKVHKQFVKEFTQLRNPMVACQSVSPQKMEGKKMVRGECQTL